MTNRAKADVWEEWVSQTALADIRSEETPDPVPMVDDTGDELGRSEAYNAYQLGRGSGDYLYLLYLLDEPAPAPTDIVPVYIGELSDTVFGCGSKKSSWSSELFKDGTHQLEAGSSLPR